MGRVSDTTRGGKGRYGDGERVDTESESQETILLIRWRRKKERGRESTGSHRFNPYFVLSYKGSTFLLTGTEVTSYHRLKYPNHPSKFQKTVKKGVLC